MSALPFEDKQAPAQPRRGLGMGSRLAIVGMLSVLAGADIWIFTAAEISSLPQVQVQLSPAKVRGALSANQTG